MTNKLHNLKYIRRWIIVFCYGVGSSFVIRVVVLLVLLLINICLLKIDIGLLKFPQSQDKENILLHDHSRIKPIKYILWKYQGKNKRLYNQEIEL